ncbi:MAG TPA: ribokinase [Bacteroidales bacterium]|mgnify:CR=1 FL=1|nr:ribokinase [Bacteroidales bacterium]HPF03075.1 ribokinase [Bacteroidales bacterium]HPJ60062.1 ribokinase [Bacteroidales bacterium]HPR11734.1 ribokinase [Bacteroidales bacterium]HRW85458.1 ribokinase [Bacteroidales bacterium]
MNSILVIGSSNTDMVIKTDRIPVPGETILGGRFFMNPGGKGANQAVAASRLGGKITFITKRGNDLFGNQTIGVLMNEGINTEFIVKDPDLPSGVALITVDAGGENCIVVAPGANGSLLPSDIPDTVFSSEKHNILLLQLEIPVESVIYASKKARENGLKVILNPAPAQVLSDDLLENIWMITPNETEAEILTGIPISGTENALKASDILINRGVENVIITLGEDGAWVKTEDFTGLVPGVKVKAVDTTAAGDVFNGALAVALSEGMEIREAVMFANKAAALSVTKMGAQASAPFRNEIA